MTRLSALTAATTVTADDLLHIADDPAGANIDKKITVADLLLAIFNSPTIVTPTIASFINANHTHADASEGGTVAHSVLTGLTSGDPHTQYLVIAPATAARNTVQPSADVVPLILKGKASQTADLQQWQLSDATVLAKMRINAAIAGVGALEFNSKNANSPISFGVHGGVFEGTFDPLIYWGYNWEDGARGNTSDSSAAWVIEADYLASGVHYQETYFQTYGTDGTYRRWFASRIPRDTPDNGAAWALLISPVNGSFNINRSDTGATLYTFTGGGVLGIGGSPQIQFFAANPVIQATVNTPIAVITNGKYTWHSNSVEGFEFGSSKDGSFYKTGTGTLTAKGLDTATATITDILSVSHATSGTPAASFGVGLQLQGKSSTTADQSMARIRSLWTTATHASRATRSVISGYDSTGERDVIGWGANGSAAILGFFDIAAAPITKPVVSGSRGANAALASLLTQLAALGLITDSSSV